MRDAGDQHADGRQALLADDLALQRLERFSHLALEIELAIQRLARAVEIVGHPDELTLQSG